MIIYGSGKVVSGNPVCLCPKVILFGSGAMYDRAPSQSASDGLKPYLAPLHWILKPLALGAFSSPAGMFDGNNSPRLVALGAADNSMVWSFDSWNGIAKMAETQVKNDMTTQRLKMIGCLERIKSTNSAYPIYLTEVEMPILKI